MTAWINGTLTKPIASCKSTASSAETSALLAMKRLNSNGYALIGSSSSVTIISISHWLCNFFFITHQLILLLGIWSGQLFVETYLLLGSIKLVILFGVIIYIYDYFNYSSTIYYPR
eukprot:282237_1